MHEHADAVHADARYRLRRWLPARMMGTTGMSWLWWALVIATPIALVRGEFGWDLFNVVMFLGLAVWARLEGTAWAAVDDEAVRWRSFLNTQRVPLADIADLGETPFPFLPGDNPVIRLTLRSGRGRRIGPTLGVGARARADFAEAIRTRLP